MSFESLLGDSSRRTIEMAFNTVEVNPKLLQDALNLCKSKYPISMRAARVVQIYAEKYPDKIIPYLPFITDELLITKVDGVKRSFLKILILIPSVISIKNSGLILDKCMDWFFTDKEAIAVRAYCGDIIIKFAKEEPELKNEIFLALENLSFIEHEGLRKRCIKKINENISKKN